MPEENIYRLRGHHIQAIMEYYIKYSAQDYVQLDIALRNSSSEGKRAYDDETIERLVSFIRRITKEKESRIVVVNGADNLCNLCNNTNECNLDASINDLDNLYLKEMGLKAGNVIKVGDILRFL